MQKPKMVTAELFKIAYDVLKSFPPRYIRSILGTPSEWVIRHPYSEFTIVDPWQFKRVLQYAMDISIPEAVSCLCPRRASPTRIICHPDHQGQYATSANETWFFINGIGTNLELSRINAEFIAYLFHRPITIIQNPTNSVFIDIMECAVGRAWKIMNEPAVKAYRIIAAALQNPHKDKVVVIAHSQGTIIMETVLRALKDSQYCRWLQQVHRDVCKLNCAEPWLEVDSSCLKKLEIYAFANCADDMRYIEGRPGIPWIESFGNQYDVISWLGMLSPKRKQRGIVIDGPLYVFKNKWGHLLNQHYLVPIAGYLQNLTADPYTCSTPGHAPSRLYRYYRGAIPENGS